MKLLYAAVVLMAATFTSAGIVEQLKNIHVVLKTPTIPQFKPFEIRVNGLGTALGLAKNVTSNVSTTSSISSNSSTSTSTTTPAPLVQNVTETSKPATKAPTNSKTVCGDHIQFDVDAKKSETFQSNQFPNSRSAPYACSWEVKVSKKCPRAEIRMTVNPKSRLAFSGNCNRGYFRVSPFMQDAKVCGNISLVPEFKWLVDDQQPDESVNIVMKNIGLSDGKPEGMSFTLSGECVNEKGSVDAALRNNELASKWLSDSAKVKQVSVFTRKAIEPASKLSSKISIVGEEDEPTNPQPTEAGSFVVLSDDTAAAVASIAAAMTHNDQPNKPVAVKTTKKPMSTTTTSPSTTANVKTNKPTNKPRAPTTKPVKRRPGPVNAAASSTTTTTAAPSTESTTTAPKISQAPTTAAAPISTTTVKPQRIINPLFALFRRLHWL